MDQDRDSKSFWATLPGIFTALAGTITAIGGLLVALNQAGLIGNKSNVPGEPSEVRESSESQSARAPSPASSASALPVTAPAASATASSAPAAPPEAPARLTGARKINLLSPDNGGHLVIASSDDWKGTIDGKENPFQISYGTGKEAVYGFRDEHPATFDTFTMLINGTEDWNVKEFELLVGNSPTGSFESIGKFQTQNVKIFATPYQPFTFQPVKAKYLKLKLLSTFGGSSHPNAFEFQLLGIVD